LVKQAAKLHPLETVLLGAREIAEELSEVVVLYFIDMAIAEARMKSPPSAGDHKTRTRNQSRTSRKKTNIPTQIWRTSTV
jgi:hypothetical protein